MTDKNKDIRDDEFRVIGQGTIPNTSASEKSRRKMGVAIVSAILVIAIGILTIVNWPKDVPENPNEGLFENAPEQVEHKPVSPLGTTTDAHYTEKLDTVINDVHLSIYIPHNAKPELAAQAADIRKDNRKILGAFVLKGEPLAWGLSKKGFCAIIEDKVTVGVSENSPLFEEATEKEGYFFRQFPLVDNGDNGALVENEQKNKTMRKALCSRAGQIFMAVSETDESMHDFAQALVDLGVENAIYLVGSHSSFGWYIDEAGEKTLFAPDVHRGTYKNENYIIWK